MLAELAALTIQASQPSFDCRMASSGDERAICDDAGLSDLDARVTNAFESLFGQLEGPAQQALVNHQRYYLQQRRRDYEGEYGSYWTLRQEMWNRLDLLEAVDLTPNEGVVGRWGNGEGHIFAVPAENGRVRVRGLSVGPTFHTCEFEGVGELEGNTVVASDSGSTLTLSLEGPILVVATSAGFSFCGLNATLEGDYFQVGAD